MKCILSLLLVLLAGQIYPRNGITLLAGDRVVQQQRLSAEGPRYPVKNPGARPDLEREMLALINKERKKRGLAPVKADQALAEVARRHSRDMYRRAYFSHYNPEGEGPFDRIKKAKIPYRNAGENIALAQSLAIAHERLMKSAGHRKNILRPVFGRVGIGIVDGGEQGIMVTQNFGN